MKIFKSPYLKNIIVKSGNLTFDDFDIDPLVSFEEQELSYKEDIIQMIFGELITVDVGFYPEFQPDGFFKVEVILDCDWTKPVYKKRIKSLEEMKNCLQEAIDLADEMHSSQVDNKLILS